MKRYLLTALLTAPLMANATGNDTFTYQGKPVHPACFAVNMEADQPKTINLQTCSNDKSNITQKDGYVTNQKTNSKQESFSRYAVLGNQGERYLIVSGTWTGGSGFFSNVSWYQKTDHTLVNLKTLASGDRCNGGIETAGHWQYAVNLTPVDMLSLANGTLTKLNAYQDLDASAAACVAKAIYQFNPETQTTAFKSLQLNKKPLLMERWVLELKYQYCFNRLYNTFVETNRTRFSQTDLDHFKNQFETLCMDSVK